MNGERIVSGSQNRGLILCVGFLSISGLALSWALGRREMASPGWLPGLFVLQAVWVTVAVIAATFARRLRGSRFLGVGAYGAALTTLAVASLFSAAGLPARHVSLGVVRVNVPELAGMVALCGMPFAVSRSGNPMLVLAALLAPAVLAACASSMNAAVTLSLAGMAMWTARTSFPKPAAIARAGLLVLALPGIAACAAANWTSSGVYPDSLTGALGLRLVLDDPVTGANAHTEFVLSHATLLFGALFPLLLVAFEGGIIFFLWETSRMQSRLEARLLSRGLGAMLAGQLLLNVLVCLGVLRTPDSSVVLPFVSYSGTFLVMTMVCLAVALRLDDGAAASREAGAEAFVP